MPKFTSGCERLEIEWAQSLAAYNGEDLTKWSPVGTSVEHRCESPARFEHLDAVDAAKVSQRRVNFHHSTERFRLTNVKQMVHGAMTPSHVCRIVQLTSCPNEQSGPVKSEFIETKIYVSTQSRYCCDTNVPGSSVHTLPPSQSIKLECKYPYQFPNGSRYM